MRKKVIIVVITILAIIPYIVDAQIKLGVKVGINYSDITLSKDLDKVFDASKRVGTFAGPSVLINIPKSNFAIDAAALYDLKETKLAFKGINPFNIMDENRIKLHKIIVPISVRYNINLGKVASIFVFGGPELGFNIGNKEQNLWSDIVNWKMTPANVSYNVGIGFMVLQHFQITANYNGSINKNSELNILGIDSDFLGFNKQSLKANAWQLGFAYYF